MGLWHRAHAVSLDDGALYSLRKDIVVGGPVRTGPFIWSVIKDGCFVTSAQVRLEFGKDTAGACVPSHMSHANEGAITTQFVGKQLCWTRKEQHQTPSQSLVWWPSGRHKWLFFCTADYEPRRIWLGLMFGSMDHKTVGRMQREADMMGARFLTPGQMEGALASPFQ